MAQFSCSVATDCRDVLLPLVTDQLSGQLDDHSSKPDYEACVQLLSTVLDSLDRKDVVRSQSSSLEMQTVKKFNMFSPLLLVKESFSQCFGGCKQLR